MKNKFIKLLSKKWSFFKQNVQSLIFEDGRTTPIVLTIIFKSLEKFLFITENQL